MYKYSRIILLTVVISAFLFSCKQKSETAKMIPSDAVVVAYFDTKSLMNKLPFEDIKATQMYKDVAADSSIPAWGKEFLDDPRKTGIDMDKGMVFFTTKGNSEDFNFVMEGSLRNAADFEKLNQNLDPSQKVAELKGIKSLTMKNNGVVAWNDKNFVYVFNTTTGQKDFESWSEDTTMMPKMPKGNLDQALSYAQKLFTLPADSTIGKEDKFNTLMNQSGDIRVWLNNEQMFKLSPQLGMLGMLKLDALIKDSRSTFVVNFNNGEINVDQKGYYGKEMTDLIKKYKGDAVKTDDFTNIPSTDVLGAAAFNFKPEGLKEGLKLMGLDGMLNTYGAQIGLTLDDVVGAIDGRVLLSFSDLNMNKQGDSTSLTMGIPDFNFLFKIGIKDKAKLQKVLDGVSKAMGITAADGFTMSDKEFVISNHKEFAESFLAGKSNNKPEWANNISGEPGGFYLNINKILSSIDSPTKDSIGNLMLQKSKAVWGEIFNKSGDISDNAFTGNTRITLLDKNTNSLKTLNTYFDQMYQLGKEQKKKWNVPATIDTTALPPVADSTAPIKP